MLFPYNKFNYRLINYSLLVALFLKKKTVLPNSVLAKIGRQIINLNSLNRLQVALKSSYLAETLSICKSVLFEQADNLRDER